MTTDELRRLVESKGFAAIHDLRADAGPPQPLRLLTVADLERMALRTQTEYVSLPERNHGSGDHARGNVR